MGLTPMDLFNDIITTEVDLRNFVQSNVDNASCSLPGLIIQGQFHFSFSGMNIKRQKNLNPYL